MDARRRRFLFRAVGGVALLLILAGSITDVAVTMFWDRNAMLTSVLADVLVLVVGVAVVNEWLDIRSAERWRTVAYYALVELLEASRDTWIRLSHELDVARGEPMTVMQLSDRVLADGGAAMLRDRAAAALEQLREAALDVDGATVKDGSAVLELFTRGASKGDAVVRLAAEVGSAVTVFVGDDLTDEDAFTSLTATDVSVKVGESDSAARHRLRDTGAVAELLRRLADKLGPPPH